MFGIAEEAVRPRDWPESAKEPGSALELVPTPGFAQYLNSLQLLRAAS